jgi:hypothetical protein
VKIRQRRASRARTEEQANIMRASCRVPGCESVPAPGIRGNSRPVQPFFDGTAASSPFCHRSKSERCLRALLNLCGNGGVERTRSHNQIIRFCTLKVARGRPVPDLPPTSGLTLSAGNLTHKLGANKRPDRVYPVRSLVRPLYFARADSRAALETWAPLSG